MPPRADESTIATLFADIHYFISPPTQRPRNHRFEKGSYVYLYHDPQSNNARIEVANNPGAQDQDAFEGPLAQASISYTHRHPCLLTLTLHHDPSSQTSSTKPFHLPNYDAKHARTFLYPLHTIDIYFWRPSDALSLLSSLKSVHHAGLDERDAPPPNQGSSPQQQQGDAAHPLIQKLEQVAIDTPYRHSAGDSVSTTNSTFMPPPPPPGQGAAPRHATSASPQPQAAVAAYNPAAPAAPEPIAHREKTPPPVDDGPGGPTYGGQYQGHQTYGGYQPQGQTFSPPPSASAGQTSFPPPPPGGPPPNSAPPHQTTFSPPPSSTSPLAGGTPQPNPHIQATGRQSSFSSTTSNATAGQKPKPSPLPFQYYAPPPTAPIGPASPPAGGATGNIPLGSPSAGTFGPPPPPPHPPPPQSPPASGYSNFAYTSSPQQSHEIPGAGSVHAQAYRPTEAEAGSHGGGAAATYEAGPGQAPGRLEARADRLEKGVNRFLRKLDKKF